MSIFPMIQPDPIGVLEDLPMYKEVAWDFERNIPIYQGGRPKTVEGNEAILVWAWKALHTKRYKYDIYTWDYGAEIEALIGQAYSNELKQAEAIRYVKECLLINPYITSVKDIKVVFDEDKITIECKIITIYGGVDLIAG